MRGSTLLTVDAIINLLLGLVLVICPGWVLGMLDMHGGAGRFFPSILGAVLVGIGVALLIERPNKTTRATGLGLGGAVSINLAGGIVLAAWLIAGGLAIPTVSTVLLWGLVAVLVGISAIELAAQRHPDRDANSGTC